MDTIDPDLQTWLEEATVRLAPYGRSCATEETLRTYTTNFEACLGRGLSQAEARRSALAALGDANDAARYFGERLPTLDDLAPLTPPPQVSHENEIYRPARRSEFFAVMILLAMVSPAFFYLFKLGDENVGVKVFDVFTRVFLSILAPLVVFSLFRPIIGSFLLFRGRFGLRGMTVIVVMCLALIPVTLVYEQVFSCVINWKGWSFLGASWVAMTLACLHPYWKVHRNLKRKAPCGSWKLGGHDGNQIDRRLDDKLIGSPSFK